MGVEPSPKGTAWPGEGHRAGRRTTRAHPREVTLTAHPAGVRNTCCEESTLGREAGVWASFLSPGPGFRLTACRDHT